jgi:uncharacterized membrane protein YhhN
MLRIVIPLVAAFACLIVAGRLNVPIAGFALFIVAMGLVLDAGSILFARVTSTGGMRDHKQ